MKTTATGGGDSDSEDIFDRPYHNGAQRINSIEISCNLDEEDRVNAATMYE